MQTYVQLCHGYNLLRWKINWHIPSTFPPQIQKYDTYYKQLTHYSITDVVHSHFSLGIPIISAHPRHWWCFTWEWNGSSPPLQSTIDSTTGDEIVIEDVDFPPEHKNSGGFPLPISEHMTTGSIELPISLPTWLVYKTRVTAKLLNSLSFQCGFFLHSPKGYNISVGRSYRCAPTVSLSQQDVVQLFADIHILQGHNHHIINRP